MVANLIALCRTDDVWEGGIRQAVLPNGHKLALYQVEGCFYATDDTCTHGAASLADDGTVEGHHVECGWHNGRFDIRTGEACAMPCTDPLRSWLVQIVDGKVCVVLEGATSKLDPA
jgi:p-cumate 2,3-dioxygenase ferredoxin subunit